MDAMADEPDSQAIESRQVVFKAPPVSHSINEELDEDDEEGEGEGETTNAEEVEVERENLPPNSEHRRPSPPSFLKQLGEELQLEEPIKQLQSPNQSFHYSKQHTGLKNLSFNVGAAVMPSAKMEFVEEEPGSYGVVKVSRRAAREALPLVGVPHKIIGRKKCLRLDVPDPEKFMRAASKSAENLTDQGYLDLKFYHNKLW